MSSLRSVDQQSVKANDQKLYEILNIFSCIVGIFFSETDLMATKLKTLELDSCIVFLIFGLWLTTTPHPKQN